jgi:hypothetical protein
MDIKMTGAEWKRFYNDQTVWKNGAYHDDSCILVNGVNVDDDETIEIDKVADDAVVEIECGLFYESEKVRDPVDLLPVIRAWQKSQTVIVVSVEIQKEKFAAFKKLVGKFGGKVL